MEMKWRLPRRLLTDAKCQAALIDLDGDGSAEILLLASNRTGPFKAAPNGGWTWLGFIANVHCRGIRDAWTNGQLKPVEPRLKEIDAYGVRLRINQGCAQ